MTTTFLNRPTARTTLTNAVHVLNVAVRPQYLSRRLVTSEDLLDESLLATAIERRGNRPLSSYRSLEDLMKELGD